MLCLRYLDSLATLFSFIVESMNLCTFTLRGTAVWRSLTGTGATQFGKNDDNENHGDMV